MSMPTNGVRPELEPLPWNADRMPPKRGKGEVGTCVGDKMPGDGDQMISQTAEYALRAIVFLAAHPEQAQTAEDIAAGTRVPVGYLAKIMRHLARAGLVSSQRGLHGGFALKRRSADYTVYDVVQAVDPIHRIATCPAGIEDHGDQLCVLHRVLDDAAAEVERRFRTLTIGSVVGEGQDRRPLCSLPKR